MMMLVGLSVCVPSVEKATLPALHPAKYNIPFTPAVVTPEIEHLIAF
jgi:hypothetical protein